MASDEDFMTRAIQLAKRGEGWVEPNPMVGCLLVRDGEVIGEGYHQKFGGPHAEVNAIASVDGTVAGATAYVTLEPCCHHGKTPPCSQTLIDAGVTRVVVATSDPFPQVDGGGLQQLEDAGIETSVGLLQAEAHDLLAPYLKRTTTGMPWVIAKWAMTLDGRIATVSGESKWITSAAARQESHRLRSRVDAIAVGMGTVTADDPQLDARLDDEDAIARQATRVVFCRHRLPDTKSKLVQTAKQIPLLLVVSEDIPIADVQSLIDLGAEVLFTQTNDCTEMVSFALAELGREGMTNVMVEGGGQLLASFFEAGHIDECHVYLGPKIFGGQSAPGPISGRGIGDIAAATSMKLLSVDQLDGDLRAVYRR